MGKVLEEEYVGLRYVTPDGSVFKSESAATEYMRVYQREAELRTEVARYLDLQDWSACKTDQALKRERTKAENTLHGWLAYDIRQRPDRYGVEFDEYDKVNDVIDVRPVEVA